MGNVESKVSEVRLMPKTNATPGAPSENDVPQPVWAIAAHTELGPTVKQASAPDSMYYTFSDNSEIQWSLESGEVVSVELAQKLDGSLVNVPLDVLNQATTKGLGPSSTTKTATSCSRAAL